MPPRLETRDLGWRDTWRAARLLADAYRDGAIWAAAGRTAKWQRDVALTLLYLAELLICRWEKGFALGAVRGDKLEGVLISYTHGERTTPWWGWTLRAFACVFAGPVAVARCVRISNDLDRLKPREPHVWHAVLGPASGTCCCVPGRNGRIASACPATSRPRPATSRWRSTSCSAGPCATSMCCGPARWSARCGGTWQHDIPHPTRASRRRHVPRG